MPCGNSTCALGTASSSCTQSLTRPASSMWTASTSSFCVSRTGESSRQGLPTLRPPLYPSSSALLPFFCPRPPDLPLLPLRSSLTLSWFPSCSQDSKAHAPPVFKNYPSIKESLVMSLLSNSNLTKLHYMQRKVNFPSRTH